MIGSTNAGGGGSGATLTITAPVGATVTVSKDGKTKTRVANAAGLAVFKGLATGDWVVTIAKDGKTATKTVTITTDYDTAISFSSIPDFTYTGSYKITDDSGKEISVTQGDWRIRFLTSGTLTFSALNGADKGIDVFCVGGGAGGQRNEDSGYGTMRPGGGGGYTTTTKKVSVKENTPYSVVVGAGGAYLGYVKGGSYGNSGGKTSAFGCEANGGYAAYAAAGNSPGGNGGSGGGSAAGNSGGTNGGNGGGASSTDPYGNALPSNARGLGQGTTTKAFGESSGELFSNGGSGGSNSASGAANSGTGGGGAGGSGGSGIVIIRNARG